MMPRSLVTAFVGIDIAAQTFTAVWSSPNNTSSRPDRFAQTPDGFVAFQQTLAGAGAVPGATLVGMEATGAYWVALAVTLHTAGDALSVVHPAHIHNYLKSLPRRSHTDALDAHVLWPCAMERTPRSWSPPPAVYHELRQRLVARDAVAERRQQARNQRHAIQQRPAIQQWPVIVAPVMDHFAASEAELDGRLARLDDELETLLHDSTWAESASLLQSIPGIGTVTTAWLLVATINFHLCASPAAAVAFVGVAPFQHESGTSLRGRPHVPRGGHARLRRALDLASLSAAQHNPVITTFYARLKAAGKPARRAHCAAARTLLHLAWAVVTTRQRFDPAYHVATHSSLALA